MMPQPHEPVDNSRTIHPARSPIQGETLLAGWDPRGTPEQSVTHVFGLYH